MTEQKTIWETAQAFEPQPLTKNIADLNIVHIHWLMEDRKAVNKDGEEFHYKVLLHNKEEFRVPSSVLKQLKEYIEELGAQFEWFKVKKKGTGLNTEYTVINMPKPSE